VYPIKVGDSQAKSGRIAELETNNVMLVPVKSGNIDLLKVQT
jgi:hypothetical protein